jgi:hypothetical protein
VLVFGGALFTGCGNEERMGKLVEVDSTKVSINTPTADSLVAKADVKDTVPVKTDSIKPFKAKNVCEENPKEEVYYNGGVEVEVMQPDVVGLMILAVDDADTLK